METLIDEQARFFNTNTTRSYLFRKNQLLKLKAMLEKYEKDIYAALKLDLNKSKHEALVAELGVINTELNFTLKHLQEWMKEKAVPAPLTHSGTKNKIIYEPYGTTLIIAPWNYPIQLAILPAIGALAAGNTVILKPSELTQNTSNLLAKMISETFDSRLFAVIEGGKDVSEQLLKYRFDYIFFTGSAAIAKIIMRAASNHLTPVTLELGGKSPAIVDIDCNIMLAAKRIVWGKFINAGQTCVAPDYIYVHESIKDDFLKALRKQIRALYGKRPLNNKNYARIVHKDHFLRLRKLLEVSDLYYGGDSDKAALKIEPTIVTKVSWEDDIMQEEIFGPILPVLTFNKLQEVTGKLRNLEKPLALYYFSNNKEKQTRILHETSSGGVCINDTLYHLANPHLPFGGVGQSGSGSYHGKYSFKTFSHEKSVLIQTTKFDLPVRYPTTKIPHFIKRKLMK